MKGQVLHLLGQGREPEDSSELPLSPPPAQKTTLRGWGSVGSGAWRQEEQPPQDRTSPPMHEGAAPFLTPVTSVAMGLDLEGQGRTR